MTPPPLRPFSSHEGSSRSHVTCKLNEEDLQHNEHALVVILEGDILDDVPGSSMSPQRIPITLRTSKVAKILTSLNHVSSHTTELV